MSSSVTCPRCTAENQPAAEFCERCGFGLDETGSLSASTVEESRENPDSWVGQVIDGKYKLLSVLGEGGFGMVFEAQLILFDEQNIFALKMLRPDLSKNDQFRRRFLREARTAMGLVHPNAIPVREFGQTEDGLLYFTMDYCPGEPLQKVLAREGYLTVNRAIPLAIQMLQVMEAAHGREIIHRDLKPENVFLERDPATGEESVRIGDFGLAKSVGSNRLSVDITKGGIVGTPRYMSPEQSRGEPLDARSDLYSIGVMLFEMVSGQHPPRAKNLPKGILPPGDDSALLRLREVIPPNLVIPRGVLEVLARALREKPSSRFQTAHEFKEALEVLPSYTPTYIEPATSRRRRGALSSVLRVAMVLVALAATSMLVSPFRSAVLSKGVELGLLGEEWRAPGSNDREVSKVLPKGDDEHEQPNTSSAGDNPSDNLEDKGGNPTGSAPEGSDGDNNGASRPNGEDIAGEPGTHQNVPVPAVSRGEGTQAPVASELTLGDGSLSEWVGVTHGVGLAYDVTIAGQENTGGELYREQYHVTGLPPCITLTDIHRGLTRSFYLDDRMFKGYFTNVAKPEEDQPFYSWQLRWDPETQTVVPLWEEGGWIYSAKKASELKDVIVVTAIKGEDESRVCTFVRGKGLTTYLSFLDNYNTAIWERVDKTKAKKSAVEADPETDKAADSNNGD